ncbi:MAG: hypothetical protein ACYDDO_02630 [Acidiferrobacterales bacterium]
MSDTHPCLQGRFSVIDKRTFISTPKLEHQESLLNESDFNALWAGMAGSNVLGLYNGGVVPGASPTYKHMQLVSASSGTRR